MKKLLSLIITITIFACLVGCKKNEQTQEITELNGVWTLSYATYNDNNIKSKYGTDISIYFKGGICKIKDGDNIISGNYKVKDNTITYTINDKFYSMTSDDGGNTMLYTEKDNNNTLCIYYTKSGNINESDWEVDTSDTESSKQ